MVRFLHLADIHLGAEPDYLGDLATQRNEDLNRAFERVVDYALEIDNGIDFVIIAGDLFDRHNPIPKTLRFAIEQLQRLYRSEIPIIVAPGDHDAAGYQDSVYRDSRSDIRAKITYVDGADVDLVETLNVKGESVHIYGMAWQDVQTESPKDTFKARSTDGGYHIAVIHTSLDCASFVEEHNSSSKLRLEKLADSDMDYIALGHVHFPQQHKAGSIPVVYPGTLEGLRLNSGEMGSRKLVVVELEEGKPAKIEFVPWNERELQDERLDLDGESVENEGDLIALIRERYADDNKLLRMQIHGSAPFVIDVDSLAANLSDDFFWCQFIDQSNLFDSQLVHDWEGEETIRGVFCRRLAKLFKEEEDPREQQKLELVLRTAVQAFSKTLR